MRMTRRTKKRRSTTTGTQMAMGNRVPTAAVCTGVQALVAFEEAGCPHSIVTLVHQLIDRHRRTHADQSLHHPPLLGGEQQPCVTHFGQRCSNSASDCGAMLHSCLVMGYVRPAGDLGRRSVRFHNLGLVAEGYGLSFAGKGNSGLLATSVRPGMTECASR